MKFIRILSAICCVVFLVGCGSSNDFEIDEVRQAEVEYDMSRVRISFFDYDNEPAGEIIAEIARTEEEKRKGLMNRDFLPEGEGMVFMYEEDRILSFWMKDTLIPLDIIFFDSDARVTGFESMEPCKQQDCPTYVSENPSQFAVETNKGFIEEKGIREGYVIRVGRVPFKNQ